MFEHPRFLNAGNEGPFTLDGTRTYLVGTRRVAVIDPGPDEPAHRGAMLDALEDAEEVSVVVTHGHPDHAPGARPLADALGVEVLGPAPVAGVTRPLAEGDVVGTDQGELRVLETPGHARHHLALHWPPRRAVFVGDLLLGRGDTVWVGEYPGSVADYLASLERVRALRPDLLYPAHGPPLEDPAAAIDRFAAHRRERIRQMAALMAERPGATVDELLEAIYGTALDPHSRRAAALSLEALKSHVETHGA